MLNITTFSTFCVRFDQYTDYVPGFSTVTNLIDIFLKCVVQPQIDEKYLQTNHYFMYLDIKMLRRCIILLIPILGNVFAVVIDLWYWNCAEDALELAEKIGNDPRSAANATLCYSIATEYGSREGLYQTGIRFLEGTGLNKKLPEEGRRALRNAAALGHSQAQEALAKLAVPK